MPVHVGRNTRRRSVGSHIESFSVQKTGGSRSLLDGLDHRGKKIPIQCGPVHETGYVGLGYHHDMDIRHRFRMMERQNQLVLVDSPDIKVPGKNILAVPISPCH